MEGGWTLASRTPPAWALLDGLLAGAETRIESPEAWADRLASANGPLTARFVTQLRAEWFDAPAPDAFGAALRDQVRDRLAAWHPGWPHLWAHILRVTGTALQLGREAGLAPVLTYVLGMCHDVAKLDEYRTGEPHEQAGARFAGEALAGHLAPGQIEAIQEAILKRGQDALSNVLHDADKLDKIGATGLLRRISVGTTREWLPLALARVEDDAVTFPPMRCALGRTLASEKRAFQAWLLPQLRAVLRDGAT